MNGIDTPRPVGPAQGLASDDLWLLGARASDGEALGRLFAPHLRHLYRSAFRIAGKPEDADDALQDGLLLALRNLKQFENRSQFSTWLTRIVVNAALMQRRKNKRHKGSPNAQLTERFEKVRNHAAPPARTSSPFSNPWTSNAS